MKFEDINNMTFEQAAQELEKIANDLEHSEVPLENAVELFERADKLKKFCDEKLQKAKLKVEKIIEENGAVIATQQSDLQDEYSE